MAISIGRIGYFGLGIEATQDSAVAASVFLPFTDMAFRAHHTPIEEIASKTSRIMDRTSVKGQQWGEGDVEMNLDVINSGYLFKMALGNEQVITGTPNVHTFYVVTSGNTPKTATLYLGRDTDNERYVGAAMDSLAISVADKLATIKASMMSHFPTANSVQSVTTTSGTVLSFANYTFKLGADLTTAAGASATPANDWDVTIANNLETIFRSGNNDISTIRTKGVQVTGDYTLYFDSITERDAYYALSKRAMEVNFTGNANESLKMRTSQFRLDEGEISTGLDDFFVVKAKWVAEDVVDAGTATRLFDVVLSNNKATTY